MAYYSKTVAIGKELTMDHTVLHGLLLLHRY